MGSLVAFPSISLLLNRSRQRLNTWLSSCCFSVILTAIQYFSQALVDSFSAENFDYQVRLGLVCGGCRRYPLITSFSLECPRIFLCQKKLASRCYSFCACFHDTRPLTDFKDDNARLFVFYFSCGTVISTSPFPFSRNLVFNWRTLRR